MENTDCVSINTVKGNVSGPDRQNFLCMTTMCKFSGCHPPTMHFSLYIFIHIYENLNLITFHSILPWRNTLLWYFSHISRPESAPLWPQHERSCSVSTRESLSLRCPLEQGDGTWGSLIEIDMSNCHWGCKQSSPGGGRPPAARKLDSVTYHPPVP